MQRVSRRHADPIPWDVRIQDGGKKDPDGGWVAGELQLFYQNKWWDVCKRGAPFLTSYNTAGAAQLACDFLGYAAMGGYTAPNPFAPKMPKNPDSFPNLQSDWDQCDITKGDTLESCAYILDDYGECKEKEVAEIACATGTASGVNALKWVQFGFHVDWPTCAHCVAPLSSGTISGRSST
jgi:hypothetical protein